MSRYLYRVSVYINPIKRALKCSSKILGHQSPSQVTCYEAKLCCSRKQITQRVNQEIISVAKCVCTAVLEGLGHLLVLCFVQNRVHDYRQASRKRPLYTFESLKEIFAFRRSANYMPPQFRSVRQIDPRGLSDHSAGTKSSGSRRCS